LECGCSSGVEHNLAKVRVEGSNPFARSIIRKQYQLLRQRVGLMCPALVAFGVPFGVPGASSR
jgi:hypothetical protein